MENKVRNCSDIFGKIKIVTVCKLLNGNYSVIVESSSNTFSEDDYEISDITLCELRKFLWETFKIGIEDD
jgi:hypothetical protein